jgi:predicted RNA binding protein YcfA (HicA-like mRNA interferase family)
MKKISNISLTTMRVILIDYGLKKMRTKGGHEAWGKNGMTRPIIIQTHVNPIPIHIVQNCIKALNISTEEFLNQLNR